jgi:hypothetical protein
VALLVSTTADAQVAPWNDEPDVVVLRDGSRLEGRVVDLHVGESTTLRGPDGSLRVIRWAEIDRAVGPSFGTSPRARATIPAPPPPPSSAAMDDARIDRPPLTEPRPGTVPVLLVSDGAPLTISAVLDARGGGLGGMHLESDFAIDSGSSTFGPPVSLPSIDPALTVRTRTLCNTPCTLFLRPGSTAVHVGGAGRVESLETLSVRDRPMRVTLRSVSSAAFGTGVVMTLFGAALSVAGSFALVVDGTGTGTGPGGQSLVPIGVGCLVAGALGLVIGIPVLARTRPGVATVESRRPDVRHASNTPRAIVAPHWLGSGMGATLAVVF